MIDFTPGEGKELTAEPHKNRAGDPAEYAEKSKLESLELWRKHITSKDAELAENKNQNQIQKNNKPQMSADNADK